MRINHNGINDPTNNWSSFWVTLSNGDEVRVYDNEKGYGSVTITRHDEIEEKKSQVKSTTEKAKVLGREKRFKNTIVKKKSIEIKDSHITYQSQSRRTRIEFRHFFPR